jgi:hypothetical protein
VGSLMRHILAAGTVARLAGGVAKPAPAALLRAEAGVVERASPRLARADRRAVPLPAVAPRTEEDLAPTVEPTADDQPQRIHALPRSGRGGWTMTVRRAKKEAASRALPRCDAARGSGVAKTPDPHPSASSAGTLYLNSPRLRNRPRRAPVANSALCGDGQHPHLFREYGLPQRIRTDNGVPFATATLGRSSRPGGYAWGSSRSPSSPAGRRRTVAMNGCTAR